MQYEPQTWHYGLMAQHWAEFENHSNDAPEIVYYRQSIGRFGQPALDVACGTGRLLLPYLRAGLDVDGVDISADMVALCRQKAEAEGLSPTLTVQPMHALDLPRRYRTIYVCGSFGIGGTREQDAQALRRFYAHLLPGGVLLLDHQMPYGERSAWAWQDWIAENRRRLDPEFWTEAEVEQTADGREFRSRFRMADLNPLKQVMVQQTHIEVWQDGQMMTQEERTLTSNIYFMHEMLLLLRAAGFVDLAVEGDYTRDKATPEHNMLVFVARKPA